MIQFLASVLIIIILMEWYTSRDELTHVNFKSESEVGQTEPEALFNVRVTAENTGKLPVGYVRAEVRYPQEMEIPMPSRLRHVTSEKIVHYIFSLKRKQKITRTVKVRIDKRGCYRMYGARLYRGDFIGINEYSALYPDNSEIVVYPRRAGGEKLQMALTGLIGEIVSRRYLLQDPVLTTGIRDYAPMDPMRSISWKQTARRGTLTVREFEYTRDEACRVVLLLPDLERVSPETLDICCGLVRSISERLTEKGISVIFHTNSFPAGLYIERGFSCTVRQRGMSQLLDALGRLSDITSCRQAELISDCMQGIADEQEYIMVVPKKSDAAKRAHSMLEARSRRRVTLLAGEEWSDD